jgi:hypothetical protein
MNRLGPALSTLVSSIPTSTIGSESMISKDNAYSFIQKSGNLPTLPAILLKLPAACDNDDTPLSEIAAIISRDPALGFKALQLVNSAHLTRSELIISTLHLSQQNRVDTPASDCRLSIKPFQILAARSCAQAVRRPGPFFQFFFPTLPPTS